MALKHAIHGRDHCPKGADPIPCLQREFVHLKSWNYDTANTIPTETWRAVVNDTNDSYYEDGYAVGNWGDTSTMFDSTIFTTIEAEYLCSGWVQFNEDAATGETRIIALNFGSSDRYIEMYQFTANTAFGISQLKLPVTCVRVGAIANVWLDVWHDNGSDISIRDAEISVQRMTPVDNTDIITRAA